MTEIVRFLCSNLCFFFQPAKPETVTKRSQVEIMKEKNNFIKYPHMSAS